MGGAGTVREEGAGLGTPSQAHRDLREEAQPQAHAGPQGVALRPPAPTGGVPGLFVGAGEARHSSYLLLLPLFLCVIQFFNILPLCLSFSLLFPSFSVIRFSVSFTSFVLSLSFHSFIFHVLFFNFSFTFL